jgi:uncharacterized PurR-regulated membrane protein YhhQ (DUF165 family)
VASTELFGALRERQFRLLWLGQTTSTLTGEPLEAFHG